MSNKKLLILLGLASALTLSGCGGKKEPETEAPAPQATEAPETEEFPAEAALSPITPSDYLVDDVSEYVTLGSVENLSATQITYDITDEIVQNRINDDLFMYSEEKEVEKAAEGDTVYADVSSSIQGSEEGETEESTYFVIGDEDYGAEFDEKLIGAAANDELSFSITYGDDAWFDEWVGQTVDFKVSVTGVYENVVPEYNEEFVAENTDYDSMDEYEESIREMIEDEYTEESYSETINTLFQAVIDQSDFNGYPEDLYNACREEILSYYGQFLGEEDPDAVMEALGITEDDLQADVLNEVNLRLITSAICQEHGLEVTEEEYVAEVTDSADAYGYASPLDYETDTTREAIVWTLYENKAGEFLYENAEITPVEATEEDLYDADLLEPETEGETYTAEEYLEAELETNE